MEEVLENVNKQEQDNSEDKIDLTIDLKKLTSGLID